MALRARPAHAPGPTFCAYTPSGQKLVTVGTNDSILVFQAGSDDEPARIDDCKESNTAVVATNDFFITGSEDGSVCKFSLETNTFDQILVRCSMPIRDLSLSPDKQWVAVASDELVVKVVNTSDMDRVLYLRDQDKPVKHVAFDYSGSYLALSCSNGSIYIYSMNGQEPHVIKKIDGLTRALENDDEASSKVEWHPDGRTFAAATPTRDVQVMSKRDWENQRAFKSGHSQDVTAVAWSPNGAMLVTASKDERICLWETKTQQVIQKIDRGRGVVQSFSWHPTDNLLSYTNTNGELWIHTDFIEREHVKLLQKNLQPSPFIHDPLAETNGNVRGGGGGGANGIRRGGQENAPPRNARQGTPDTEDVDMMGPDDASDDGFLEDDDGAGYAEQQLNGYGKRPSGYVDDDDDLFGDAGPRRKRQATGLQPRLHESFQPGSTPWRGNRRYLCLNLLGFVWTIDQDTHHTVTCEFYDHSFQRDFHFTDPYSYDKACLTTKGTLFSSPLDPKHQTATLYYRPHSYWTSERPDWRATLPKNESVTSIALSHSYIVVCTSADYVRVYTLFGVPLQVYRAKSTPTVACASFRDYVLTAGNGAASSDGSTRLQYTIRNLKTDTTHQSEDTLPLPSNNRLVNLFFSDAGDPHIYDSSGTLLVLLHWRTPAQAQWVPLLDTRALARRSSGRKEEEDYWPVAVAGGRFYCIVLKGGERYPYFPRPLLSDLEFCVPVRDVASSGDAEDEGDANHRLEEAHLRLRILHVLLDESREASSSRVKQQERQTALATTALDIDKSILQLLAAECVAGDQTGMKCMELVGLFKDESGKMLEAAGKVAARFGRSGVRERVREVEERRAVGLEDAGESDEDEGGGGVHDGVGDEL